MPQSLHHIEQHTTSSGDPGERPQMSVLPVYDLTPFTMLDYPGRIACVIWMAGCNFRCPYCHNPQIVRGKARLGHGDILDFLETRRGRLDGVVFSGGEATLFPRITDLAKAVKQMGYAIKLDTNGTRPATVEQLIQDGLVDYIALDYKAPPHKFQKTTRADLFAPFAQTLDMLCGQDTVPFEVRTTVHTALLKERDIAAIIFDLEARGYRGNYYVQNFIQAADMCTMEALPPQPHMLDIAALPVPERFSIATRNF